MDVVFNCLSPTCGMMMTDLMLTRCVCCDAPLCFWEYELWVKNKEQRQEEKKKGEEVRGAA